MIHQSWLTKKIKPFISNESAVIDLPMKLLVSLIIGTISLTVILSFLFQPVLFEKEVIVSVNPTVAVVNETSDETLFTVTVSDENAHYISNAQVIFHGDHFIQSNMTDKKGQTTIRVNTTTSSRQYETFADVKVKASGYHPFFGKDLVKIVYQ